MAIRLSDEQLDWLAGRVPDASVSEKGGKRRNLKSPRHDPWHRLPALRLPVV